MDYLCVAIAILLPWLGGYLWLAVVTSWLGSRRANPLSQIGYGLFLGYGALQGIVLAYNSELGQVTFLPILLIIALVTLIGGVLFARRPAVISIGSGSIPSQPGSSSRFDRALFWLFLSWALVHLLFVAIEILHRPVFPWDAWLNWMYRAKAWFYSGYIFTLNDPTEWLSSGEGAYNVAGNHYPTFVPVMALWVATSLGHWSETLINLPVLCCGIALGLALYGQCREYGLEKWPSALGAYLLLSIPLVGAHMSLAGQADIWMAGLTGLGFVALLHGIIRDKRSQIFLGFGMVAIGIATKLEGAVWLIAALLTFALARHTRYTLWLLFTLACLACLGWAIDITYLDLPVLGRLGVADGRLHIPLLGNYGLQSFDLWDDYRDNFVNNGTWHLLWLFVLLSALSLKFLPAGILRRTVVAFYCVLLAAHMFIFEGTQSGKWAEDWTAINRLPLHFAPALVFTLVILGQAVIARTQARRKRVDSPAEALHVVPLASLLLTLGGALVYLLLAYPGNSVSVVNTFAAQDMRIVVGNGRQAQDVGIIERYQNNVAIVSSGPVQLDAAQLGLARVETAGPNRNRAAFFWRNGAGPDDLHSAEISGRGTHWISLEDIPAWQGSITEIGLIFYADGDRPVEFRGLDIVPAGLLPHLSKLARDWRETTTWSQKSVNWIPAGAEATTLPLPALMGAWVVTALLLAAVLARRSPKAWPSALLCALLAWVVLDIRWTANRLTQAAATLESYPPESATYLDYGEDRFTRQLIDTARPEIERDGIRTVIMAEDQNMDFQILRAKYHALPAAAYAHAGSVETVPVQMADYLLVLKKRYAAPGHTPAKATDYIPIINQQGSYRAAPVWDEAEGFLLSIKPTSPAATP